VPKNSMSSFPACCCFVAVVKATKT
jgi:hypothetical protein